MLKCYPDPAWWVELEHIVNSEGSSGCRVEQYTQQLLPCLFIELNVLQKGAKCWNTGVKMMQQAWVYT